MEEPDIDCHLTWPPNLPNMRLCVMILPVVRL